MGEWLMFTNEQKEQLLYLNFEICPESYRARKLGNWEIYGSTILQIVISQVTGWVNFSRLNGGTNPKFQNPSQSFVNQKFFAFLQ
jgi:hypothetical protein